MFVHVRCTTMHQVGKGVIFNSKSMPTPLYAHHVYRRGNFMSFAYTNITTPYRVAGSFRIGSIQTLYVNINTRVGFLANITEFNVLKALLLHKQPYERELFRKGHVEVLHKQVYIELGNVFAVIILSAHIESWTSKGRDVRCSYST